LRQELERYQIELNARASELDTGDGAVKAAGPAPVLDNVARLFEVGDAEELRDRLLAYSATEAARILSNLDGERAAELLNALPDDKWKEYVDAFSSYSAGE
jgi:hypothetical protein